jgi:hypothetical protein
LPGWAYSGSRAQAANNDSKTKDMTLLNGLFTKLNLEVKKNWAI